MKFCKICTFSLAALMAAPLVANAADSAPWYVGADVGRSHYTLKTPNGYSLSSIDTSRYSVSEDRTDTGLDVFFGYRINRYVAVEAGYMDLGKYTLKLNDLNSTDSATGTAKVSGLTLSALWQLPLNEQWTIFARTGIMNARGKVDVSGNYTTETYSQKVSGIVPVIGLGASYAINKHWEIQAQYQDIGAASIAKWAGSTLKIHNDLLSLGARYSF